MPSSTSNNKLIFSLLVLMISFTTYGFIYKVRIVLIRWNGDASTIAKSFTKEFTNLLLVIVNSVTVSLFISPPFESL